MKAWNVSFACEERERSLAKKFIGPNLASESVVLTFTSDGAQDELREAPFAYVTVYRKIDLHAANIIIGYEYFYRLYHFFYQNFFCQIMKDKPLF